MPFVERSGAKVHFVTHEPPGGRGPWITLVNGYSRPLTDFRAMGRFLVDRGFRVATLDNRGAGETVVTEAFSAADMVGDIAAVWDAVGASQSHLLGISLGGMLCQCAAADFPGRVRSLILVSTAPRVGLIEPARSADPEQDMLRYFSPRFREKNGLFVKALSKETARAVRKVDPSSPVGQRAALKGFDAGLRLREILAPTLVVHGEADEVIRAAAARELVAGIRGARLKLFPEVGHLLLAEAPRDLYAVVAEFCASVDDLNLARA